MVSCINTNVFCYFKKLFSSFEKMDIVQRRRHLWRMKTKEEDEDELELHQTKPKSEFISVEADVLSYAPDDCFQMGMFIGPNSLNRDYNYFEVEILDSGSHGTITIGLVPSTYSLQTCSTWSLAYHADDGMIYRNCSNETFNGKFAGQVCEVGDRMGCGLNLDQVITDTSDNLSVAPVYLTKNGREISKMLIPIPLGGLHPAISMHSYGEEVRLTMGMRSSFDEESNMSVDGSEQDWMKLHYVQLYGNTLEYNGKGRSITDVGLAQAKYPLDTTSHYFEIEILDPGQNCYIAIGLARKSYPRNRHPGWNKGSIAYHADDGKIFIGGGNGEAFGPRCNKGDVMGCGILFPHNYVLEYDSDVESNDFTPSPPNGYNHYHFKYDDFEEPLELDNYDDNYSSESEDEEWWKQRNAVENGMLVKVFFTRNRITIGSRTVGIPKGGFYPTIGMLSKYEKVKYDLHPISG